MAPILSDNEIAVPDGLRDVGDQGAELAMVRTQFVDGIVGI
jgi:hypothetical protein